MGASCYQNVSVLRRPTGFLKVLQVILALTCLGLIRHYILSFGGRDDDGQSYYDRELLGKTSVGGMVLVTLPALIGAVFGQGRHTLTDLLHCLLGVLLFLVSGVLVLDAYAGAFDQTSTTDAGIATGSLCLVNALLYLIDSFFTYKEWKEQ